MKIYTIKIYQTFSKNKLSICVCVCALFAIEFRNHEIVLIFVLVISLAIGKMLNLTKKNKEKEMECTWALVPFYKLQHMQQIASKIIVIQGYCTLKVNANEKQHF